MTFIFITSWIALFIIAIRTISRGWKAASELGGKQYINEKKRYVTKTIHPEMRDIKEGDELLVVNFDDPQKELDPRFKLDSPELHNLDPLNKSLRDRIKELNEKDDDEDGDVPTVVRR
tara:strand:+ start:15 stop:368 length:354 start_codon:yes stop_codon:yes gene_type:complete